VRKSSLSGTLWNAHWSDAPDWSKQKKTMSRVQQAGLTFERKFGKTLRQRFTDCDIRLGPWILYCDDSGWHYCQPDIVMLPPEGPAYLFECKLKHKPEAEGKVRNLYVPILHHLIKRPIAPFQVCKHLGLYLDATYSLDSFEKVANADPDEYRIIHHV